MFEIIIYILIPTFVVLMILGLANPNPGSDHYFHLNTINRIKRNGHKFINNYLFSVNEEYPFYPQLYHWVLSFLPERIYRYKFKSIGIAIRAIEIIAFNLFLYYLYKTIDLDKVTFLYANIVFNAFPFSYASWNAKNRGLSARGVGLLAGQVYLYLLIFYLNSSNLWVLLALFVIVFIILLLSQMALQFVLLSLPLIVIIFSVPEILPIPFLAYGLFYLLMPKVAKFYIVGQFNHKRNYALFMVDVIMLRDRPSIYRDFVYDFWVKLKMDWRRAMLYMYKNPLVEVLFGFIFFWFVVYVSFTKGYSSTLNVMYLLSIVCLALFFLTSLKWTRFLGEPQRYVEFAIPLISILFSISFRWEWIILLLIVSCIIILVPKLVIYSTIGDTYKRNKNIQTEFLDFIKDNEINSGFIYISNSALLLRLLFGIDCTTCNIDLSKNYKDKSDFNKYIYNGSYVILGPHALNEYDEVYDSDFFVYDNAIGWTDESKTDFDFSKWVLFKQIGHFDLYRKNRKLSE